MYKSSLWWLNRAAGSLNPNVSSVGCKYELIFNVTLQDDLISPYMSRLLPSIQQTLTTARQRLILPGMPGHQADTSRAIHDIQEILSRRALPA